MTAQEAYILAKAYTNKSIEGAGSLKGAACQIKSIEAITGGHRITFEWEDNDGEVSTDTMDVMDGADGNDGVGISSITYKETDAHGNYVYTVTLTDTNTYDIICPKGAQGETGATGATGNGIASIVKTSTAGLVDTYTITYTNGQTTTFTVTNGESITVDSAMSGSSTNPVQNKVITEALADKQDAEDNNLTTEAKTIAGAINEHEGDISSLKSGLTTLDNEVNGDATTYPYADVITIEDAVPANLADCSVKVEPVQDLHGQSSPYVGGAGKNKFPDGGLTTSGTTYTDGVLTNTSTDTRTNFSPMLRFYNGASVVDTKSMSAITEAGRYSLKQKVTGSYTKVMLTHNGTTTDLSVSLELTGNANDEWTISFYVQSFDPSTVGGLIVKDIMLENGLTETSFAPYTNICPITGHTEASVQRDGVNIFNPNALETFDANGEGVIRTGHIFKELGKYTVNNKNSSNIFGRLVKTDLSEYGQYVTLQNNTHAPFTVSEGYMLYVYYEAVYGMSAEKICVKYGDDTTFVDYEGKTYTLALGDTIYGGTVDFDSGVMTVTHGIVDLGDFTWTVGADGRVVATSSITGAINPVNNRTKAEMVSDSYVTLPYFSNGQSGYDAESTDGSFAIIVAASGSTVNYPFVHDSNLSGMSAAEVKTALTGCKILYELATPTTIQLTPTQIQLLQGTNTIYASTGQISVTVNGVSGAIGQVQEQVNELAEDVETQVEGLESELRSLRVMSAQKTVTTSPNANINLAIARANYIAIGFAGTYMDGETEKTVNAVIYPYSTTNWGAKIFKEELSGGAFTPLTNTEVTGTVYYLAL